MARVYLSLGSNLGDREANLRAAIERLREDVRLDRVSSIYETDPVGVTDQPSFLNLALSGETELSAEALLKAAKEIEREVGRVPSARWGPRAIDIDLLLYDDLQLESEELAIPHPRMIERAFVLIPLAEIAPAAVHPSTGTTIQGLREKLADTRGVRLYAPFVRPAL